MKRSRTWWTKWVSDKDGWIYRGGVEQCCTKIWKLGQSEGITTNVRQELELKGGADGIDGVGVGKEVS